MRPNWARWRRSSCVDRSPPINLKARDSSPILPPPSAADAQWLSRLASASRQGNLVLRLEHGREHEPLVRCEPDGSWWAGRYVGSVLFEGRRLDIAPRFGEEVLGAWIAGAFNLALVETTGRLEHDDAFVARLLAAIWTRSFVAAARHGAPHFRIERRLTGVTVAGRLDVPTTVGLRATGSPWVGSIRRDRSLDHPISAAIVAAGAELGRALGRDSGWLPDRVKDILAHMAGAVGAHPAVPTANQLQRVRLTPITAAFGPLAALSARIASRRGLSPAADSDSECTGLLLDVAELWELYVLGALRQAWPDADVAHGTRTEDDARPLLSNGTGRSLGQMLPDALVRRAGRTMLVADSKYKRLHPNAHAQPPQREDLYQIAAYVGRFAAYGSFGGALLYPLDPANPDPPIVEVEGPWMLSDGSPIRFLTLPHRFDDAVVKLRAQFPLHAQ